ncbi:MAG: hypothetical protein HYX79_04475 [Chloroflexi bacterium]|nr:hypothetical protein [Chloroflexota bacterium]
MQIVGLIVIGLLILGLIAALIVAIFPSVGYRGKRHSGRTWRPEAAGVLEIIAALFWGATSYLSLAGPPPKGDVYVGGYAFSPFFMAIAVLGFVGGVFALRRRNYGVALSGSIALSFAAGFGIPALILIILSRKEFDRPGH